MGETWVIESPIKFEELGEELQDERVRSLLEPLGRKSQEVFGRKQGLWRWRSIGSQVTGGTSEGGGGNLRERRRTLEEGAGTPGERRQRS